MTAVYLTAVFGAAVHLTAVYPAAEYLTIVYCTALNCLTLIYEKTYLLTF